PCGVGGRGAEREDEDGRGHEHGSGHDHSSAWSRGLPARARAYARLNDRREGVRQWLAPIWRQRIRAARPAIYQRMPSSVSNPRVDQSGINDVSLSTLVSPYEYRARTNISRFSTGNAYSAPA